MFAIFSDREGYLNLFLILSILLFCISLIGVLHRKDFVGVLASLLIGASALSLSFVRMANINSNIEGVQFAAVLILVAIHMMILGGIFIAGVFGNKGTTFKEEIRTEAE